MTGSDSGAGFPAEVSPVFERTLRPLNIPPLWFYKCNQCYRLLSLRKMRLKYSRFVGTLDMLLCDKCLIDYNEWTRSFGLSQSVQRRN